MSHPFDPTLALADLPPPPSGLATHSEMPPGPSTRVEVSMLHVSFKLDPIPSSTAASTAHSMFDASMPAKEEDAGAGLSGGKAAKAYATGGAARVDTPPASTSTAATASADPSVNSTPARVPRRMSLSDRALLDRALREAAVGVQPLSRPGTAERARRAKTRQQVSLSQRIATEGGMQPLGDTEVFCLSYAPGGDFLLAGCGDGSLRVFDRANRLVHVARHDADVEHLPTTCIRFNPANDEGELDRLLLSAHADGSVACWSLTSDGALELLRRTRDASSSVYALDWQSDGGTYATGGRDHVVRLYDARRDGALLKALDSQVGSSIHGHGHSNRIFALRFHPTDANLLLSGGWDNTIQMWDLRAGSSVRSIYGPHLCGDALDVNQRGDVLLTGSWRENDALERWDLGSGKRIDIIAWHGSEAAEDPTAPLASSRGPACMLYAASFSPDNRLIAAGGAGNGVNQAKIFDASTGQPTDRVSLAHGVYALNWSPNSDRLVIGGVDPFLTVVNL